jgi:hypothetical protein
MTVVAAAPFTPPLRPVDRYELSAYLSDVRDLQEDFEVKLAYHGDLLTLEEDALTFEWSEECQKQLDELVKATCIPFTDQEGAHEGIVVYQCCPNSRQVGALDQDWVFDDDKEAST